MGGLAAEAAGMAAAATRRAIRVLLRLVSAGALAAVAGIIIGAVATAGGLVQLLVTAFAAFALWIPAFLLLSGFARWRGSRQRRVVQAREQRRFAPIGGAAWDRLEQAAESRAPELRALRSELAGIHAALPVQSLDPQVHDLRVLIEKRIPQLIDSGLACLPDETQARSAATSELVDLVGRFARGSREQERILVNASRREHDAVRRRIEGHLTAQSVPVA